MSTGPKRSLIDFFFTAAAAVTGDFDLERPRETFRLLEAGEEAARPPTVTVKFCP